MAADFLQVQPDPAPDRPRGGGDPGLPEALLRALPRAAAKSLPPAPTRGLPHTPTRGRGPGRPFEKGQSGNPAGRAKGSRNRATEAAERLLDGEAERLTRKAIELALKGDPTALKLCFDRILAPRRERTVRIALPPFESAADLAAVTAAIMRAAAEGRLSPGEAFELAHVLEAAMRAINTSDFEKRIKALEEDGVEAHAG